MGADHQENELLVEVSTFDNFSNPTSSYEVAAAIAAPSSKQNEHAAVTMFHNPNSTLEIISVVPTQGSRGNLAEAPTFLL